MRQWNLVDGLMQDVRFAIRQLVKRPVFAATAVFTLTLGICASVAIFAFVDAALVKPLPYAAPARLLGVFETTKQFPQSNLSYLDYLDWKKANSVFSALAAYHGARVTLTLAGGAQPVPAARISDDFFRTLGVTPIIGRDFQPGEDRPGAAATVVLSYAAWQERYAGQTNVLGTSVSLNDEPTTIIGVLPPQFHFSPVGAAEFWTPLRESSGCYRRRSCHNMYGVGRLRDGVSFEQASANLTGIARQLEQQYPDSNRDQGAAVAPLADVIVGTVRPTLLVLLGGAGLLLLIATVNVAGLLLVRSESRRREMAVRAALGASAARVIRQFVTEGLLLVLLGSALGLALARVSIRLLAALIPSAMQAGMPYLQGLGLNGRVLGFAALVALLAAMLFTLVPALHLSLSGRGGLAEGSRGSAGLGWRRIGSRLVMLELAMAMVLLVAGGLLGKSLRHLLDVDMGLQAERLAVLSVAAPDKTYGTSERRAALGRSLMERVGALPGVTAVGLTSTAPLRGGNTMWIKVVGRPYNGEHNEVHYREVTGSYFSTLQARLARGRYFADTDDASKPWVAIVNETLARQYFPGQNPVGQRLQYAPNSTDPPMEIVGVVEDIKEGPLDTATPPTIYVAFAQDPTTNFSIVVRTATSERALLPTLSAAIHEIDPGISTFGGRSMAEIVQDSQPAYFRRSAAWLVGAFAGLAWLLGVVGLYGVIAFSVGQRTREIGVRMALGAQQSSVHRLVLREAGRLAAGGVVLGLIGSIGAAMLMRGLLFGVGPWDPSTLGLVAVVLFVSAMLASYLPAHRAASINPLEALRAE